MSSSTRSQGAKVGLVGCGMVGASFAYALIQRGLATELVLVDADTGRAEGEAMDLNHGVPFVRPVTVRAGSFADLDGARVVVVAAGANQRPGESRLDLLQRNADVMRNVIPQIVANAPDTVIVIATNPVDILTQIAANVAQLPHGRVFGSGTILDTARFRSLLGTHYGVDPRSVHAVIIGEHGDSELAVWSSANIANIPMTLFTGPTGKQYDRDALDHIFAQTRDAAYEIIKRKRATYYAIGLGLLTIVEAILRDQHTVLTVSTPMQGYAGVQGIALSLPTIVGKDGAEEVLALPLDAAEEAAFRASGQTLLARLNQLTA